MSKLPPYKVYYPDNTIVWAWVRASGQDAEIRQVVKVLGHGLDDHGYAETYTVDSQFGEQVLIHSTAIDEHMTVDNRPKLFYRMKQLDTGYAPWKIWIGPNWGNSAGHVLSGRPDRNELDWVRSFMENAWVGHPANGLYRAVRI